MPHAMSGLPPNLSGLSCDVSPHVTISLVTSPHILVHTSVLRDVTSRMRVSVGFRAFIVAPVALYMLHLYHATKSV